MQLSELRHGQRLRKLLAAPLPASFDCRVLGLLGAIKNQASCGSCWNFSGTCVVEGAYAKAGKPVVLSEQYTMSCGRNGGCNGDDNVTVLEWAKATGLPLTSDYGPYTANSGHCNFKQGMALYKLNDWGFCDGTAGYERVTAVEAIKASMIEHGPIGCAVAAGGSQFWNDGMGTCTGRGTGIDHDVVLVAWDDNHDNGDGTHGAWVMRNSWGCYDEATEILTSRGWLSFKDVKDDEIVATLNPDTHVLEYNRITAKQVYDYRGDLWSYQAQGVDLLVTPNHRLYIGDHLGERAERRRKTSTRRRSA